MQWVEESPGRWIAKRGPLTLVVYGDGQGKYFQYNGMVEFETLPIDMKNPADRQFVLRGQFEAKGSLVESQTFAEGLSYRAQAWIEYLGMKFKEEKAREAAADDDRGYS